MPADVSGYRYGLFEMVLLLLLLLLAFGAITVIARDRWLALGLTESLLARLAAATVLASMAVGGLSGVVINLLQVSAFSDSTLSPSTARGQALLGIGLALALTVVAILRIEAYHRRLVTPPAPAVDAALLQDEHGLQIGGKNLFGDLHVLAEPAVGLVDGVLFRALHLYRNFLPAEVPDAADG